ncbi:MAG: PAC2 family protein [Chloroflexota bacterium]
MYDYMPHTRPLLVTGSAVGEGARQALAEMKVGSSDYQGPTSITGLITQRAPSLNMDTMSLIVHLPQYTQLDEDYMGTARVMELLGPLYHVPVDEAYLNEAARQIEQVNRALERNPQLKAVIEQLENQYEARTQPKQETEKPPLSPEIEKFLSEMEKRFRDNQ